MHFVGVQKENVPISLCISTLLLQLVVHFGEVTEPVGGTMSPKSICLSRKVLRVYNCAPFIPPTFFLSLLPVCGQNMIAHLPTSAVMPHILCHDGCHALESDSKMYLIL